MYVYIDVYRGESEIEDLLLVGPASADDNELALRLRLRLRLRFKVKV